MASLLQRPDSSTFYIQFMVSGKAKRVSTGTDVLQIAKAKLRQFETDQASGEESLLPTKTPIPVIVSAYLEHIRSAKTAKSATTDVYYLRDAFGPVCDGLKITSRQISVTTKKRPPKKGQDRRRSAPVIASSHFEAITTAQISAFIAGQMACRGLSPKTGNRIRDTLSGLFTCAMTQRGVKMPGAKNPAIAVKKYKEPAPEIEFLSLEQIDQQLDALRGDLKLQVMVAVLIYAGLRREELLWLTHDDIDWTAGTYGLIRIRAKTIDGESWEQKTKKNRGVFISKSFACTSRSDLADFAGSVGIAGHGCGIPSFLLRHAAKNFGLRLNIASSFLGRDFWHQKVRDQLNFYRHDRSYRVCRLTVRTMKELTKFFRPLFVLNKHDDAVKARGDQRIRL